MDLSQQQTTVQSPQTVSNEVGNVPGSSQQKEPFDFKKVLGPASWTIIALLAPLTALILLSQNSLPGDIFYPVKRGLENGVLAMASINPTTKAIFHTNLANNRFDEAQKLLLAQANTGGLSDFVDEVSKTQAEIEALTNVTQKTQLQEQLDKKINTYQQQLRQTQVQLSAEQPSSSNSITQPSSSGQSNSQNAPSQQAQTTVVQYIYITNPATGQKEQVVVTATPAPSSSTGTGSQPGNSTATPAFGSPTQSQPGTHPTVAQTPTSPAQTAVPPLAPVVTPPTQVSVAISTAIDKLEGFKTHRGENERNHHDNEGHQNQSRENQ